MANRHVESDKSNEIMYIDAKCLYGWAMGQSLHYDEINFDETVKLEDILNTPDDSEKIYFNECDLSYSGNIKKQ